MIREDLKHDIEMVQMIPSLYPSIKESDEQAIINVVEYASEQQRLKEQKQVVCGKCFNARMELDDNLTDDNDMSSFSIGKSQDGFRMMYTSGDGKPPRIEVQQWHEKAGWRNIAIYYPKYCPECGREITEYKQ